MELLWVLGCLLALAKLSNAGVVNGKASPTKIWPSKTINFKWSGTDATEYSALVAAMDQISADSGKCVSFTDISRSAVKNVPFISIQPKFTGSPTTICWTYHGFYQDAGNRGQVLVAFSSRNGNRIGSCLDNKRDIMRVLMNVLGVRNEFMRADRSPSNMVFPTTGDRNKLVDQTIQNFNIFSDSIMYSDANQAVTTTTFDLNSVTMVTPERFAQSTNAPVFTIPNNGQVGNLARLSLKDCQTLNALYGCSTASCTDPYASATGGTGGTVNGGSGNPVPAGPTEPDEIGGGI